MRRLWTTKLWALAALLLVLSILGLGAYTQLEDLLVSHRQYRTLSSFYGLEYAEMIKVIGPPDVDDDVKGIIEWHSLGAENLAFVIHYPSEENRRKPSGITVLFRTWYGDKRCQVGEPPDEGHLAFLLYYHLQCVAVIRKPDELWQRDEWYRAKRARLAAITSF